MDFVPKESRERGHLKVGESLKRHYELFPSVLVGRKQSKEHIEKRVLKLKGKKRSLQQKLKISGVNNSRWVFDRSKLKSSSKERYGTLHKEWSISVKKRDGWGCKINSNCSGKLQAHHILSWRDYPELRYDINNGITLCHAHHPRKRADEAKLSPFFQKLVAEMK